MTETLHALIDGLPTSSADHWRALADAALRGEDFDSTLVRDTPDGIERGPVFFETERAGAAAAPRKEAFLPWHIRQIFTESSPSEANAAILADLMGGVSEIGLQIDRQGAFGVTIGTPDDLARTLEDVDVSIASVFLESGHNFEPGLFADWMKKAGANRAGLGVDAADARLADLAKNHPGYCIASIDARVIHETGGTEAHELAFAAAGFAEAFGKLIEAGISAAQAAGQIEVVFAADADIHLSLSKIRAGYLVLQNILDAYDAASSAPEMRAVTSGRMMTRKAPWTNMIRTSAAGFAAACSGVTSLTVLPATHALGRPDRLARRAARNLHILLQEEAHSGLVDDPAGGSYLHEHLTAQLAEKAWKMFQSIEADGGYSAIGAGSEFVTQVETARQTLLSQYQIGERVLFGINRFAAPDLRDMKYEEGLTPPSSASLFPAIRLEDAAQDGAKS